MSTLACRLGGLGVCLALLAGCAQMGAGAFGVRPGVSSVSARAGGGTTFTPRWVKDAVFYQIFPERFENGDRGNDPPKALPWGGKPENFNYFGGDLAGVMRRLPYLRSLGVNAIYLNPIFKASSNHKYNTADYMQIDPAFGTNQLFRELLSKAHGMGIRVILDGVFNHTGDDHLFFQDAVQKGDKSPYWEFYTIWGYPVVTEPRPNYNAWWGFGTLPQLRAASNRKVQEYLFDVTEYWTRQGIDGWRLDVPNEIDNRDFWREWRKRVRAVNPQAYIVGEIWDDGSSWLQGDQFDAVMNYIYREILLDFFAKQSISVDDFDARLTALRNRYGQEVTEAGFNILGSHDVPRLRTEARGSAEKAREAMFFQFISPGAPLIYYGDELGMEGAKDPDNRRTMPWEVLARGGVASAEAQLSYVQQLIAIRRAHPALRAFNTRTLMRHNHHRLYACIRQATDEKLIVGFNSGVEDRDVTFSVLNEFSDNTSFIEAFSKRRVTVQGGTLTLPKQAAHTGFILIPQKAGRSR